ncbi:MAG: CpsD/CapB family tyrosine-protein kinase [Candidatus Avilachnospira sp.]|jgi:capsular exopolysaccharide synthesis family protein
MGILRKEKNRRTASSAKLLYRKDVPFSYSESYKALRTNIEFLHTTGNCKTILVTGTGPGEGKTTICINLAYSLAENGKKVLLADCDLRKGTMAAYLRKSRSSPGITDVIAKRRKAEEVITYSERIKADVLLSGVLPQNPAELIGSEPMVELIGRLSDMYDYVIIDTPPVSVVTDAAILSRYVDGCILTARADMTTKQALYFAKKSLTDVNANILGLILNDIKSKGRSYGGGYY